MTIKIHPLISVVAITYNASETIIETLDSIKNQSYKNIELIISDDCSTDETIAICHQYIQENDRISFIKNAQIVSTEKNSGITPNYNNALKYATGDWIKYIADDILEPNCIEEYVNFTIVSEEKIVLSGITPFTDEGLEDPIIPNPSWLKGDVNKQLKSLLKRGTFLSGPTMYVHRETLIKLGGFDEKYPFIEDYPIFIKFLKNNYRLGYINKTLVRWRKHPNSVSHSNPKFESSIFAHFWDISYPEYKRQGLYLYFWHFFLYKKVIMTKLPLIIKRLTYLIDPIGLIYAFQKRDNNKR